MKPLRQFLDKIRPAFEEGGKLERLYPLFEATDTFLYTTDEVTTVEPHVRDSMDLKRIMTLVVYALTPCVFMAMWNTGYQANTAMQAMNMAAAPGWRGAVLSALVGYDPSSFLANIIHGALYFIPLYIVSVAAGGVWEVLFGIVRKEDVNEGLLVTSLIFPPYASAHASVVAGGAGDQLRCCGGQRGVWRHRQKLCQSRPGRPGISLFCLSGTEQRRCGLGCGRWDQRGHTAGGPGYHECQYRHGGHQCDLVPGIFGQHAGIDR